MTIFTVPRGQVRALIASLLPHAGKQSEKTPLYGRVRFAPGPVALTAWTVDGSTAAASFADVDAYEDAEADIFDLSVPALRAALAVFRGPSDADARQMWEDQPLRFTVEPEAITLEEVDGLLEGRQLVVERWVTAGEDHYPDVPRLLTVPHAPTDDDTIALLSPTALAKFLPSAKAWETPLRLTITGQPHRVEVRVGSRFAGLCPALRRDDEDETRARKAAWAWLDRLTPHARPDSPQAAKDAAAWHLATGLRALGMTGLDGIDDEYAELVDEARTALADEEPDEDATGQDEGGDEE